MSETPTESIGVEESILASVKKVLGIDDSYTVFDLDVLMFINGAFTRLSDLGIVSENGFTVTDRETPWGALEFGDDEAMFNGVKTYVCFVVRIAFDPPQTTHHINAIQEEIKKLEWNLNTRKEAKAWVSPVQPQVPVIEEQLP